MSTKEAREKEAKKLHQGYGAARTSGMGLQDEKLNPGKIYKAKRGSGLDLPVINSVKPTVNKTKRAQNLSNYKIQFNKQKSRAGVNPNSHFDKKKANVVKHTRVGGPSEFVKRRMKLTGPFSSMDEMRQAKGFKPGESNTAFLKRRMDLRAATKAVSATKIGKIALGVGAAGVAASQYLKSKMKKDEPEKKNKSSSNESYKKGREEGSKKFKQLNEKVSNTAGQVTGFLTGKRYGGAMKKMGGGMMKANEGEFIKRRKALRGVNPFSKQKLSEAKDYKKYLKGLGKATSEVRGAKLNSPAYNINTYDQKSYEKITGDKGKAVFKDYKGLGIKNEDQYFKEKNAYAKKMGLPKPLMASEKFKNFTKTIGVLPKVKHPFEKKGADKFTKLKTLGRVVGSSRVGKIALGIGAVGLGAKKYLESKMKKNEPEKKMGGGMVMQKPMGYRGGGMDMGKEPTSKMKTRETMLAYAKAKAFKNKGTRLTDKDIETVKSLIKNPRPGTLPKRFVGRNMGGMMQKPMGYRSGTMVQARGCKLGRTRPTKIT